MVVAKARKSTHSKGKGSKNISRGKVGPPPVRTNPNQQYEIDEIGPIYLTWGRKRVRSEKGKRIKKYYIKAAEKHRIWIKWKQSFDDKPDIFWSAEPMEHLSTPELKQIIRQKLADKKIWPFPSQADGQDTGYEERANICKKERYQLWQSSKISEQGQTWRLLNGIDPTTASSDASTSETSESEAPDEEDEEEEDEV